MTPEGSAPGRPVAVEVRGLSKTFGAVAPIRDLNLEIFDGEFLVILGPSAGKSTLLRLIAGLEQPSAGRVLIDGQDVTPVPARDRGCGFVFQSYALFPHMTVLGNIAYGLRRRGVSRREAETREDRAGPEHVMLQGHLALVERLGADALAYVQVGDQTVVCRVGSEFRSEPQGPVSVDLDLRRASWFDADSGDRLRDS